MAIKFRGANRHDSSPTGGATVTYDDTVKDLSLAKYAVAPAPDQSGERLPFIQCEYCHAMGNGPGDLEDYWQCTNRHPGYCGNFVWEWCDHAISNGMQNNKPAFLYGGDHGEFSHDINFCVDGLVYPDRRPSPAVLEYKNVMRPVRFAHLGGNRFSMTNRLDFIDLNTFCEIAYEVFCDGVQYLGGWIDLISWSGAARKRWLSPWNIISGGRPLIMTG